MFNYLKDKFHSDKNRIILVIIATTLSYLFAHGFRMANTMFSGDSLLMIYQNDYAWQISLGRCFQPIWLFIRGSIAAPWMITILSIVWLGLSVYLSSDLLDIKKPLLLSILSGIMTINTAIICTNATFVPWSDLFALALFLAVLGVWLIARKNIYSTTTGILCLTLSLGTYQAYISVALTLVVILIFKALYIENKLIVILKKILSYAVSFLIAGVIYYICWKIFQKVFHIWTSNSYNGMADIGDYSSTSIASLLLLTYKQVIYFFWNPDVFVSLYFKGQSLSTLWIYIIRFINILVIAFIITATAVLHKRNNKSSWINFVLGIIILAIFPVSINIICLISKGMVHSLMNYSYNMVYILGLVVLSELSIIHSDKKLQKISAVIIPVSLILVCWVNAVFANQIYLKKQLQEDAAKAEMSRIVMDIEKMDDYQSGQTKVSFIGSFADSTELISPEGFDSLVAYGVSDSSMFYHGTEEAMIINELNVNMNIINIRDDENYTEDIESKIDDMSCYPATGSIKYIGDIIVVKISD